jgi:hypothetical protein
MKIKEKLTFPTNRLRCVVDDAFAASDPKNELKSNSSDRVRAFRGGLVRWFADVKGEARAVEEGVEKEVGGGRGGTGGGLSKSGGSLSGRTSSILVCHE